MPTKLPEKGLKVSVSAITAALDEIDQGIAELIQQRVEWVAGAPESVEDVLAAANAARAARQVVGNHQRELNCHAASNAVFKDIDILCRGQIAPLKVVFLGPLGTYTHDAALQIYGSAMQAVPVESFKEIFTAVEDGTADYGVAPIENSTEGAVNQTHDLLVDSNVNICGEVRVRIRHCLISGCDNIDDIKAVHAHPQSLAQCRQWLNANLPGVECVSETSNAAAATKVAKSFITRDANAAADSRGEHIAAIASESAANRYELNTLARGIEDIANNTTRFIVIGRHSIAPTGNDATSLLISASHKPGGLRRMLQPLEDAGVNMTRIESRPARTQLWEYVFFIDVTGHQKDAKLAKVLEILKEQTPLLRVLGSYPRASA